MSSWDRAFFDGQRQNRMSPDELARSRFASVPVNTDRASEAVVMTASSTKEYTGEDGRSVWDQAFEGPRQNRMTEEDILRSRFAPAQGKDWNRKGKKRSREMSSGNLTMSSSSSPTLASGLPRALEIFRRLQEIQSTCQQLRDEQSSLHAELASLFLNASQKS